MSLRWLVVLDRDFALLFWLVFIGLFSFDFFFLFDSYICLSPQNVKVLTKMRANCWGYDVMFLLVGGGGKTHFVDLIHHHTSKERLEPLLCPSLHFPEPRLSAADQSLEVQMDDNFSSNTPQTVPLTSY